MGDRASYAIRESGEIHLFYSQFGANTLLADIFWGPEAAESAIREQERADSWLDDVYGEAAVAVCKDTKRVAFYDCRYSAETRDTAAKMMAALWPGWTVLAVTYVSAVAATLGVDLSPAVGSELGRVNFAPLDPGSDDGGQELPSTIWLEIVEGGARSVRLCDRNVAELLRCGPALLEAVSIFPSLEVARAAAASLSKEGGRPTPLLGRDKIHPASLVRVDSDRRAITVTLLPGIPAVGAKAAVQRAALAWPGFAFSCAIAEAAAHFEAIGERLPRDLLAVEETLPLVDQLRELGRGVLGAELLKEVAAGWLDKVAALTGLEKLTPPPAIELTIEERLTRFARALSSLGVSDTEAEAALSTAAAAAEEAPTWSRRPELALGARGSNGLVAYSEVEHGGRTYAVYKTEEDGRTGAPPTLLAWSDPASPPEAICALRAAPMGGHYAGLRVAPRGDWLVALVGDSDSAYEVVVVDLRARSATPVGRSGPRADFRSEARVTFDAASDRFSIDAIDTRPGVYGEGVVLVFDRTSGPIGELPGRTLGGFDAGRVVAARADASGDAYRLVYEDGEEQLQGTAERARARLSGTTEPTFHERINAHFREGQWAELARVCASRLAADPDDAVVYDHWSAALEGLGDLAGAVKASERCVALAPYHREGQRQLARVLAASGDLERAARAAQRACDCNIYLEDEVYGDPRLSPLHGHPAFRALDYLRLVSEAQRESSGQRKEILLRSAIELDPTQDRAYEALLAQIEDEEEVGRLLEQWHTAAPGSFQAQLVWAKSLVAMRTDEAESALRHLMERWPEACEPPLQLARVRMLRDDRDGAISLLRESKRRHAVGDYDYELEYEIEEYEEIAELAAELEE